MTDWWKNAPIAPEKAPAKDWWADAPVAEPTDWLSVGKGAISNLGKSFKENLVDPIIHPVDTAKGLLTLGKSVMAQGVDPEMAGAVAQTSPENQKAFEESQKAASDEGKKVLDKVRQHYVDRYGSMEGFKKALMEDPVGIALDASIITPAAEASLAKAGLSGAKIAKGAADVTGVSKLARGVGELGAAGLGHASGAGPEAVKQAIKAGYDRDLKFLDALSNKMPMEQTVKLASQAVGNMRKERNAQYQAAMEAAGLDKEAIDFNKVLQSWQDAQKTGHFEGVPLSARTEGLDKQVLNTLEDWYQQGQTNPKFFTAEGLDALKKKIGSIRDNIPYDKRVDRKYVGDLYNLIREQISEQAPIYDKIMRDYSTASEGLEEIEKALSLGDKATYDTGIRKLLGAMRNNANTNYGNRLKMVDKLEEYGAKGLKSQLAGSQMSSVLPRGLAGRNPALTGLAALYDPRALALLPLESPQLVGRGLYAAGSVPRLAAPVAKAAGQATTPAWAADLLHRLNQEEPNVP